MADLGLKELDFGREDSEEEDLDANPEKVAFGDAETKSLLEEIRRDLEAAEDKATLKDAAA